MASVEERLARLERKVDRYRRASVVLLVLMVAAVTVGQTANDVEFDTVTCQNLRVIDPFSKTGVRIGTDFSAGAIELWREGRELVRLNQRGLFMWPRGEENVGPPTVRLWSTIGEGGSLYLVAKSWYN